MSRSSAIDERRRGQGEPDVGVRELGPQPAQRRPDDRAVVERRRRQRVDRVPGGVLGQRRVEVGRDRAPGRRWPPSARAGRGPGRCGSPAARGGPGGVTSTFEASWRATDAPERLVGQQRPARAAPRRRRTARSPAATASRAAAPPGPAARRPARGADRPGGPARTTQRSRRECYGRSPRFSTDEYRNPLPSGGPR